MMHMKPVAPKKTLTSRVDRIEKHVRSLRRGYMWMLSISVGIVVGGLAFAVAIAVKWPEVLLIYERFKDAFDVLVMPPGG